MMPTKLALVGALLWAGLTFVPGAAAIRASRGPSVKTIERLLKQAYCAPATDREGRPAETVSMVVQQVERSRRRVVRRKTFFPIAVVYTCTLRSTQRSETKIRKLSGSYLFFRDSLGHWVQKNVRHTVEETTQY